MFSQHTTLSAPVSVVIHTPQGALVSTHGVQRSADGADECGPPYSLTGMVVMPKKWYALSAKTLCVRSPFSASVMWPRCCSTVSERWL